jgi:hypothetical protein
MPVTCPRLGGKYDTCVVFDATLPMSVDTPNVDTPENPSGYVQNRQVIRRFSERLLFLCQVRYHNYDTLERRAIWVGKLPYFLRQSE